jgi:hypothetical protein
LNCFTGVVDAGCRYTPVITGGGRKSVKLKCFKWVNIMLGNLKNSLRENLPFDSQEAHAEIPLRI